MKFSKHQKEIIKLINEGKIYNISSYLTTFNLRTLIQYNKTVVDTLFEKDPLPKSYYYPTNVNPRSTIVFSEEEFTTRKNKKTLSPDSYSNIHINMSYSHGIKHLTLADYSFTIDFYKGVYIANSFDKIIDFLSLWQYLKSEMLILDAPYEPNCEDVGIFYQKSTPFPADYTQEWKTRIKDIDFTNYTYDDSHYLNDFSYTFSDEYFNTCKEFWNRRIYKTPKLTLFIKKGFKTTEERMQNNALLAAWSAIFVSVLLPFIPMKNSTLENIEKKVICIESLLQNTESSISTVPLIHEELLNLTDQLESLKKEYPSSEKLDNLIKELDTLNTLLEE